MRLKLIESPADFPVTLEEAKEQARVTDSADDNYITRLIAVACEHAQARTGRAIGAQVHELALDAFPSEIVLPLPPLLAVVSINYYEPIDGALTPLDEALYTVDAHSTRAVISPAYGEYWPTVQGRRNAVLIRYNCGYFTAASPASPPEAHQALPTRLRQAVLMMVTEMYDKRAPGVDGLGSAFMGAIDALLRPLRVDIW